jgi:hypothetical protein
MRRNGIFGFMRYRSSIGIFYSVCFFVNAISPVQSGHYFICACHRRGSAPVKALSRRIISSYSPHNTR